MTTIDAAAVWRALKLVTLAACAAVVGMSLSGCGTTANLFPSSSDGQGTSLTDAGAQPAQQTNSPKVAIAPVIGAPDVIAKHLQKEVGAALTKSNIPVTQSASEAAAYTLRGYVVSAREKTKTKISYIWDVTDSAGKRVNRITGEEITASPSGGDPWAAMTPKIVQAISSKTASSLAAWLPSQLQAAAVASGGAAKPNGAAGPSAGGAGGASAGQPIAGVQPGSGPTTGSIKRTGAVTAIVPTVTGAPGDGGVSLTNAMRRELGKNGVSMSSAGSSSTYRVVGRVKVGAGAGKTQPIEIHWDVQDPTGRKLGTVSQKNDIPKGSLDGAWGKTADAAAAAATQGILKLLPKRTASN